MAKEKVDIREVIQEKEPQKKDQIYNEYVKENTPKKSWLWIPGMKTEYQFVRKCAIMISVS